MYKNEGPLSSSHWCSQPAGCDKELTGADVTGVDVNCAGVVNCAYSE